MYKRILVPIDGSETSQRGLREAIALAKMLGAKMHLMHVISDYAVMVEMSSAIDFAKFRAGLAPAWPRPARKHRRRNSRCGSRGLDRTVRSEERPRRRRHRAGERATPSAI